MEMFMTMLIPVVAPLVVQLFKKAMKLAVVKLPPQMTPLICSVVGVALAGMSGQIDAIASVPMDVGAVAGLAGTGVHQTLYAKK